MSNRIPETIRVLRASGRVEVMALEQYIAHVVSQEMPAGWSPEALKAQAIAARSYAVVLCLAAREGWGKHGPAIDICTDAGHCQAFHPAVRGDAGRATRDTRGQILITSSGRPAYTVYHAACGGHTLNAEDAGPGWKKTSYLRGVACSCGRPRRGHAVGLCQYGARAMATRGATAAAILAHYYQGARLLDTDGVIHEAPSKTTKEKATAARWLSEEVTRGIEALQRAPQVSGADLSDLHNRLRQQTALLYELERAVAGLYGIFSSSRAGGVRHGGRRRAILP